jgi:hypothetical protein
MTKPVYRCPDVIGDIIDKAEELGMNVIQLEKQFEDLEPTLWEIETKHECLQYIQEQGFTIEY